MSTDKVINRNKLSDYCNVETTRNLKKKTAIIHMLKNVMEKVGHMYEQMGNFIESETII